jgi:hypothetical protein
MNKARIRANGLAALVYWGDDPSGFDRTAFVIPGLPYELTLSPATELLVEMGYGVVQPQYRGSYDSDGMFTPENCIETILEFERLLEKKELNDLRGERRFRVGSSVEILAAHSFGTYVGVGAILRGLSPQLAVMFSPMFEFGTHAAEVGLRLDLDRHARHIAAALPLTFRMATPSILRHFFVDEASFHPLHDLRCHKTVPIIAVVGDHDPSLVAETNRAYVTDFVKKHSSCLQLDDMIVVPGGEHDLETLLTEGIKFYLRQAARRISGS